MPSCNPARRDILRGLTGLALAAGAGTAWPAMAAADADKEAAARLIGELSERTIAIISDREVPRTVRAERLRAVINRDFDTESIGRFVLGKHWQTAGEAEREEFIRIFRDYTALSYARRFEAYAGQRLAVHGARDVTDDKGRDNRVLVLSEMRSAEGAPVKIDWRLRHGKDGWRIYDVIVEGVSMVLTQRSEFASVIDKNGGKLQPLLEALKERMKALA